MAVIEQPLEALEWDDAVVIGTPAEAWVPGPASRRTTLTGLAVVAACIITLLFARSLVDEPILPELASDPNGALFLYPTRDSGIEVEESGEIVRISTSGTRVVVTAAGDELDSTVLADPRPDRDPTAGARFRYTPADPTRPFFLVTLDLVDSPVRIVTVTSTDPEASITPIGSDAATRRIELRGVQGFAIDVDDGAISWSAVAWQMTPGRSAKVVGEASVDELIAVAESLVLVDLYEWLGRWARMERRYAHQARVLTCVNDLGYTDAAMPSLAEYVDANGSWFWMRDLELDVTPEVWNEIVRACG